MASLFWTIATSQTALWIDGAILLVAAVIGWFPLLKWFPLIGTYVPLARAVFVVVLFVFGVCIGHRIADESAALARVKTDLAFSQLQLDAQKQSAETAAKLRQQIDEQNATLQKKVTDYEAELATRPDAAGCNLDDNDINRLRGIAR